MKRFLVPAAWAVAVALLYLGSFGTLGNALLEGLGMRTAAGAVGWVVTGWAVLLAHYVLVGRRSAAADAQRGRTGLAQTGRRGSAADAERSARLELELRQIELERERRAQRHGTQGGRGPV